MREHLRGIGEVRLEKKLSSELANLRRVFLHDSVILVVEGSLSILCIVSLHLCFIASTSSMGI